MPELDALLDRALNKLCKWRSLYAGWWLGTRPNSDPTTQAVRDNFDRAIVLRAEMTAISAILIQKQVCTQEELQRAVLAEVQALDTQLEKAWPGFRTSDEGLVFADLNEAAATMKRRGFPP